MTSKEEKMAIGQDNIFLDLGFTREEAAELLVKSHLISAVRHTIDRRGLTQKQAADMCHTDQPTLSKVLRGRMESVTIDRLASWLTLLGRSVEIRIAPYRSAKKTHGRLLAVEAHTKKSKPTLSRKQKPQR